MKKSLLSLSFLALLSTLVVSCGNNNKSNEPSQELSKSETPTVEPSESVSESTINTHAEFVAANDGDTITVETNVQAMQSWWNGATVYCQGEDGAYFLYKANVSEELYAQLVPGTRVRVTGQKASYRGEIEFGEGATVEIIEGASYIASPTDVSALLGTNELINHQNELVSFASATIVASYTSEGDELPFLYNWDGSGDHDSNSDLYFNVNVLGKVYNFCVESYLCDKTTDVYAAVENFKIGDVYDLTGFLYWYDGANPHITGATLKGNINTKSAGVNTYAEYDAAEDGTALVVETFIQDKQSWWSDKATLYTQDADGAYFAYNTVCSEELFAKLVPGTHVRITGTKASYRGEEEFGAGATVEIINDGLTYIAAAKDVTNIMGDSNKLIACQNQYVKITGAKVVASQNFQEEEVPFLYNWDGSGDHDSNSDLYFNVQIGDSVYNLCVESYLRSNATEVYAAVEGLKIGDEITIYAYLYWYDNANPHVVEIVK